jgi:hypothetical protein
VRDGKLSIGYVKKERGSSYRSGAGQPLADLWILHTKESILLEESTRIFYNPGYRIGAVAATAFVFLTMRFFTWVGRKFKKKPTKRSWSDEDTSVELAVAMFTWFGFALLPIALPGWIHTIACMCLAALVGEIHAKVYGHSSITGLRK